MPTSLLLPELGEGIPGGDVIQILVKEGDSITESQPLLEIETDKAVVEVPSPAGGKVTAIFVKKGDKIQVGAPMIEVEQTSEAPPVKTAAPPAAPKPAPAPTPAPASAPTSSSTTAIPILLPELGEGIGGGDLVKFLVHAGDTVVENQPLMEVETDKAVVEVPSPVAGTILNFLVKPGEKIKVGQPVVELSSKQGATAPVAASQPVQAAAPAPAAPAPVQVAPPPPSAPPRVSAGGSKLPAPASPSVRRFARELGADVSLISGTGPGGRITQEDVKLFVRQKGPSAPAAVVPASALPDFSQWGEVERIPIPSLRRKIAEQMQLAWSVPMVTQFDEADITDLEQFRKQHSPSIKEAGGALTITAFALQATAVALKKFPQFNCSLDMAHGEVIQKKHIHIGVAVDTEAGLIVPVIKDVDKKSLRQLCIELSVLAKKARDRKVSVEELRGATFSISNLGGIGGTAFTPLVNPPQVAILGLSRSQMKPLWNGEAFVPRLICPMSVSYDHRVVDGAVGARFVRFLVEALENYTSRLLDV